MLGCGYQPRRFYCAGSVLLFREGYYPARLSGKILNSGKLLRRRLTSEITGHQSAILHRMLTEIGSNIWTMNGPNVIFAGASMHTRMTIVKLSDSSLWVHSPIQYTPEAQLAIKKLGGAVAALIAPNKFHYMFVQEWKTAYPLATVFAEATLKEKVKHLAYAEDLTNNAPNLYNKEIEQVVFGGNRLFQEIVFFHKTSGTLILTDLMANLRLEGIKFLPRLFLQFEGIIFPNGGVSRLYRLLTRDKTAARRALAVIKSWSPRQITFCHGEPFSESADSIIATQFQWLDL